MVSRREARAGRRSPRTRRAQFSTRLAHVRHADPVRSGHAGSSKAASSRTSNRDRFRTWRARLSNGELIAAAEENFDVLVTTDKNLRHQQSLAARKLAVLVLPTTSWPRLRDHMEQITATLAQIKHGEFLEIQI